VKNIKGRAIHTIPKTILTNHVDHKRREEKKKRLENRKKKKKKRRRRRRRERGRGRS
jgi:hypothetical protein